MKRLKEKVMKKVNRGVRKARALKETAAKAASKAASATLALLLLSVTVLCGCGTPQASRAQTATITADAITVNDSRGSAAVELIRWAATNNVSPDVLAGMLRELPTGDFALISQAMAVETGGNESTSQEASPKTSVPVSALNGDKALDTVATSAQAYLAPAAAAASTAADALKKKEAAADAATGAETQ